MTGCSVGKRTEWSQLKRSRGERRKHSEKEEYSIEATTVVGGRIGKGRGTWWQAKKVNAEKRYCKLKAIEEEINFVLECFQLILKLKKIKNRSSIINTPPSVQLLFHALLHHSTWATIINKTNPLNYLFLFCFTLTFSHLILFFWLFIFPRRTILKTWLNFKTDAFRILDFLHSHNKQQ